MNSSGDLLTALCAHLTEFELPTITIPLPMLRHAATVGEARA
jgi:hypothetical protein